MGNGTAPAANVYNPALKARPTSYKGIHMRSRMEASYAAFLDRSEQRWEYEPECFADEEFQYLPDFVIYSDGLFGGTCRMYIELKPVMDDDALPLWKRRMETIWATHPDALLMIVPKTGKTWVAAGRDKFWWSMPEVSEDYSDEDA